MKNETIAPETIVSTEAIEVVPATKKAAKKAAKAPKSEPVVIEENIHRPTEDQETLVLAAMAKLPNPMPGDDWEAAYNAAMEANDGVQVEALSRIDVTKADDPSGKPEQQKNSRKSNSDGKALTLRIRQEVIRAFFLGEEPSMKNVATALFSEFGELNEFTMKTVFNHAIATIRAIDSLGLRIELPEEAEVAPVAEPVATI
jgi:hypothetical protein